VAKPQHHYRTCRDENCARRDCIAYQAGYEDGRAVGREEGHEEAEEMRDV